MVDLFHDPTYMVTARSRYMAFQGGSGKLRVESVYLWHARWISSMVYQKSWLLHVEWSKAKSEFKCHPHTKLDGHQQHHKHPHTRSIVTRKDDVAASRTYSRSSYPFRARHYICVAGDVDNVTQGICIAFWCARCEPHSSRWCNIYMNAYTRIVFLSWNVYFGGGMLGARRATCIHWYVNFDGLCVVNRFIVLLWRYE